MALSGIRLMLHNNKHDVLIAYNVADCVYSVPFLTAFVKEIGPRQSWSCQHTKRQLILLTPYKSQ